MNDVDDEAYAARHSLSNKAPLTSMFWEPLIINDDQWLRKYEAHRRFIGEAVPCGISFISNIVMMSFTDFFIFLFHHVHVRTAVGTACGTKTKQNKSVHILKRK